MASSTHHEPVNPSRSRATTCRSEPISNVETLISDHGQQSLLKRSDYLPQLSLKPNDHPSSHRPHTSHPNAEKSEIPTNESYANFGGSVIGNLSQDVLLKDSQKATDSATAFASIPVVKLDQTQIDAATDQMHKREHDSHDCSTTPSHSNAKEQRMPIVPSMFVPLSGAFFPKQTSNMLYLSSYPQLPPSAPCEHPHIIVMNDHMLSLDKSIGFADMVVTILSMWDMKLLGAFLNASERCKRFDFSWTHDSSTQSIIHDIGFGEHKSPAQVISMFIERRVKFVTVGIRYRGTSRTSTESWPLPDPHQNLTEKSKADKAQDFVESFTYRIVHDAAGGWVPVSVAGPQYLCLLGPQAIDQHVRNVFATRVLALEVWKGEARSKSQRWCKPFGSDSSPANGSIQIKMKRNKFWRSWST